MMKLYLYIIIFIFLSKILYPQINQEWVNRYNGDGDWRDKGNSITCDSSGNIYVAGFTFLNGYRMCSIKYNSSGNREWIRTYTGDSHFNDVDCEAVSIALDSYRNVIVAGYCNMSNGGYNFCTIKYSNNGNQIWVIQYNSPENGHDAINDLAVDKNNFIYVTGVKDITGVDDYCTIKYSPNGDQIWVKTYGSLFQDEATSIKVDNNLNIYITGTSTDSNNTLNFYTIKYDSSGNTIWSKQYYSGAFHNKSVIIDKFYNVIVTGTSYNPWNGFCVLKYDSSGNQKFTSIHGIDYFAQNSVIDKYGNIYVIGDYWEDYNSTWAFCLAKFDTSGNYQWERKKFDVGGYSNTHALGIATDSAANIYVTGTFRYDYYIVKYNLIGTKIWDITYNGTGNGVDIANAIVLDKFSSIIVTGYSDGTGMYNNYDIVTIKYSEVNSIKNQYNKIPAIISIAQNYPNPFNPNSKIKYDISKLENVRLVVYDILGKEVVTLVNEKQSPGTYEVEFNGEGLASGIYFYRLTADGFSETKKMTLLK